jgi:hypothetical protein
MSFNVNRVTKTAARVYMLIEECQLVSFEPETDNLLFKAHVVLKAAYGKDDVDAHIFRRLAF